LALLPQFAQHRSYCAYYKDKFVDFKCVHPKQPCFGFDAAHVYELIAGKNLSQFTPMQA